MTTVRLTITDGLNPVIDKIVELNRGVVLESLSVAGSHVQKGARGAFKASRKHHWHQKLVEAAEGKILGKRRIFKSSEAREFGRRMSYETGKDAKPDSMVNFINSYLMKKSLVVVIGGKHPSFKPTVYKDGKVAGSLKRVAGVSKHSQAILHKLNTGKRNSDHRWAEGQKSINQFNEKWQGREFMSKGFFSASGAVNTALGDRLLGLLDKQISRIEVKPKVVA